MVNDGDKKRADLAKSQQFGWGPVLVGVLVLGGVAGNIVVAKRYIRQLQQIFERRVARGVEEKFDPKKHMPKGKDDGFF